MSYANDLVIKNYFMPMHVGCTQPVAQQVVLKCLAVRFEFDGEAPYDVREFIEAVF
jgi:hypothetical protein